MEISNAIIVDGWLLLELDGEVVIDAHQLVVPEVESFIELFFEYAPEVNKKLGLHEGSTEYALFNMAYDGKLSIELI